MSARSKALVPALVAIAALGGCIDDGYVPRAFCRVADDCFGSEVCDFHGGNVCGTADALGTCEPRPIRCPDDVAPVCGCDGVTYDNACWAYVEGTDVAFSGTCEDSCRAQDAHASGLCELFLGWYWDGSECVGISGCRCVGPDCASAWETRSACVASHAVCDPSLCSGVSGCASDEFCDHSSEASCTDADGVCRDRPDLCPEIYMPVCGCDGSTYDNACSANAAGTDVAYVGACDDGTCGGLLGFGCGDEAWCDYPEESRCGAADQTGDLRAGLRLRWPDVRERLRRAPARRRRGVRGRL
mgnify:CR=1 FL=1